MLETLIKTKMKKVADEVLSLQILKFKMLHFEKLIYMCEFTTRQPYSF